MLNREQSPRNSGKRAERHALRFLQSCGLKHLGSNYRIRGGEIDLILQDGQTLVFVEVRSRSDDRYMDALESITPEKINRIINTSRHYLMCHGIDESVVCRFDIVTLTGKSRSPKIEWIKSAFEA